MARYSETRGLKRYTFGRTCRETGSDLGDGTSIVFVNARGALGQSSTELDAFLRYLADGTIVESDFVSDVDRAVRTVRSSPTWRRSHMLYSQRFREQYADGYQDARQAYAELAHRLNATGRGAEIAAALDDPATCQQLFEEFHIKQSDMNQSTN